MNENQKKVISIRLVYIIAFFVIIALLIVWINKIENNKKSSEVANSRNMNIRETKFINENSISSRSAGTERETTIINKSQEEIEDNVESLNISEDILENNEVDIEKRENETESEQYKSIDQIKISKNMDLTERTGVSKEDFVSLISRVKQDSTKFFYNNSETIYDLCVEYDINEIFFCGLISAESGWNIASNHRKTYNYISLMVNGKLKQFSSIEDGLEQAAKTLHDKYLTPGGKFYSGKTLAGVKVKFCPNSSTWTSLVYGRMKQIISNK